MTDHEFWMQQRQALLMQVANVEALLGITPTTAERNQAAKDLLRGDMDTIEKFVLRYGKPRAA